jgi:hypothetical protein
VDGPRRYPTNAGGIGGEVHGLVIRFPKSFFHSS